MPNKLAGSTSPYLLQHQNNPVDWYPWGQEALEKSKSESKPIFLSIGYAACHWCHVMEHESFENVEIAKLLNDHFISIKVDREQRPDLDHIYMQTVQMLTGSGGWPMSVFLTPDMKPFYGGTYWPPKQSGGRPGFYEVLKAVVDAWQNKRTNLEHQSDEITAHLKTASANADAGAEGLDESLLWHADEWLEQVFDAKWGGFGGAPKFPHAMDLRLLMQLQTRRPDSQRLHRIARTLDGMADGGIYDHLGGGFARYSTDEKWLVPHFEKMLYDNALLANTYLDGYLLTKNDRYREVVCQTIEYVLGDLTHASGGFYCSRDADSEGEEGLYYTWTREDILDRLGMERGNVFCESYGITFGGNFEGANILYHPEPLSQIAARFGLPLNELKGQLAEDRNVLLEARNQRVAPGLDDKILCSWNALMIVAVARAGAALSLPKFVDAAESAAGFVLENMMTSEGRLLHTWHQGKAEVDGFLEDYSYFLEALITLFECTGKVKYIEHAIALAEILDREFRDEAGGFFFTSSKAEPLITRFKDVHDGSVPSGNAMAATALLRLAQLTNNVRFRELAEGTLRQAATFMRKSPGGAGQLLIALDYYLGPSSEWVYVSDSEANLGQAIQHAFNTFQARTTFVPTYRMNDGSNSISNSIIAGQVEGRTNVVGTKTTLFQCSNGVCQLPREI